MHSGQNPDFSARSMSYSLLLQSRLPILLIHCMLQQYPMVCNFPAASLCSFTHVELPLPSWRETSFSLFAFTHQVSVYYLLCDTYCDLLWQMCVLSSKLCSSIWGCICNVIICDLKRFEIKVIDLFKILYLAHRRIYFTHSFIEIYVELRKWVIRGNSPMVQWLILGSTFTDVAQVQFLVGELRSHTLHDVAKKKKKKWWEMSCFLVHEILDH